MAPLHLPFLDDHVDTSQSGDIAKALHEARDLDGMAHEIHFYFEQKGAAIEVATCPALVTRTSAAVNFVDLSRSLSFNGEGPAAGFRGACRRRADRVWRGSSPRARQREQAPCCRRRLSAHWPTWAAGGGRRSPRCCD